MGNRFDVQHVHAGPCKEDKKPDKKSSEVKDFFAAVGVVCITLFFGIPLLALAVSFWSQAFFRGRYW